MNISLSFHIEQKLRSLVTCVFLCSFKARLFYYSVKTSLLCLVPCIPDIQILVASSDQTINILACKKSYFGSFKYSFEIGECLRKKTMITMKIIILT